jgi:hypothetical protein
MATEDYLPSSGWTSQPLSQQPTGLLTTPPAMTPYQRAMAEMQQSSTQLNSLLSSSGGYRPGIFKPRSSEDLLSGLSQITDIRGGGVRSPSEQARIDAFFDAMTPAELAEFQKKNADFLNMVLGPGLLGAVFKFLTKPSEATDGAVTSPVSMSNVVGTPLGPLGGYDPSIFAPAPVVITDLGPLAPAPAAPAAVATGGGGSGGRGVGTASGGGGGSSSGGGGGGGSTGAVSSAVSGGTLGGTMGIGTSSLGGVGSGGSSGGGSSGGGGGCCFIMLEARYGDGTMDTVVRRYRDEKITDRNKRGYYKLAEVFVPLMRESKLFKFMVAKTFADPLVSYGKWHYGENRHGWIFKPIERFWMKVFNVLGNDTKFIRENGETV